MIDCVSCGLALPAGVTLCPGCGATQVTQLAHADEASCAVHPGVASVGPCSRCGRFMCKACHALDAGTCRSCLDHTCTAAVKELQSINVKLGGVMVLQGVIAPLTVWLWGYTSLSRLLATMGVLAVCFGLTTIATKEVWSLGFAAMAGIGFLSFFGLLNCPPLVVSVALLIVAWRLFARSSRAEKEVYRLTQLR